ncbi:hypothetical protein D9M71_295190 [compost metagenome]
MHALQAYLQVVAGTEKDRTADPQNVLLAITYMLHPWLRCAFEIEKKRGQYAGVDRRLQFQQQRSDAGQRHDHELGAADPQQRANAAMVHQAPGDQQNAAGHGRNRDMRDQARAEDREQRNPQCRKNPGQWRTGARFIAQA